MSIVSILKLFLKILKSLWLVKVFAELVAEKNELSIVESDGFAIA